MSVVSDILLAWYDREGRDLPWRRTRDPYRIWLSEVILQQTRVAQGMAYYERFTERYPDIASLAAAPEDEVLKLWQGLGYYSRARNLLAAAREVVDRFGGRFPRTLEEVRSLRGVGDYTAAAICSAAYDEPCAVVDGNVYRLLARLFDLDLPIDTTPAAVPLPHWPANSLIPGSRDATTRRSWISERCSVRPFRPAATCARWPNAAWPLRPGRSPHAPSSRGAPTSATAGSTTCTSPPATGRCSAGVRGATSGRDSMSSR